MFKIFIEKNENGVVIRNAETGNNLTEIIKPTYLDLRDRIYSDWILHLSQKTWITMIVLNELADIICKEFPKNEINWVESLRIAESIIDDRK